MLKKPNQTKPFLNFEFSIMKKCFRLERLHESGLIKKWTSHWMPAKDQCWDGNLINLEAKKHKVNMSDMQGIFFVLAIGTLP